MAGAARIGALHVMLGLNSAEFEQGLKNAKTGLGNFAKVAGVGLAAVGVAAAAAGTALAYAVKGAIDNADQAGELAQSIGVSVEALTSLGYAAKLSGADAEGLATGLRKVSQNMLAVAQGSAGPAATAFQMLGISVQNANGSLRASDQVLIDVADRFSRMEDGATKTALAVQLFGKSGADLIPFLNQGREGIGALTAEADRLGITLSSETANAAGQFNDTLDRLRATFDGVINKVMQGALPALNQLGDTLASPEFAANAQAIGLVIVQSMQMAVDAINTTMRELNALRSAMEWANNHDMFGNEIKRRAGGKDFIPFNTPEQATDILREKLQAGQTSGPDDDFFTGILGAPGDPAARAAEATAAAATLNAAFEPVITNTKAAGAAASSLNSIMNEGKAVFEATRTPAETYALEVENLNRLLQAGAIDQDTYNRAVVEAQDVMDKAAASADKMAQSANAVGQSAGEGLRGLIDGTRSWNDALGDVLSSLAKIAFESINFGGGAGGGVLSGLLGGLFGFANGGSFQVGGSGGVDSQLVAFKASPNERVSVTKPGQEAGGGGGGAITVDVQVGVQNGALVPLVTQVAGQVAGQQIKQNNRQLPNLIQDMNMRQG